MLTFAREPVTESLLAEAMPLLQAHWAEVAAYDDIPLAVDTHTYLAAGAAGVVRCFTVRSLIVNRLLGEMCSPIYERRPLVGYALFFVKPHAHYAGSVQAVQDVVYLDPACRGGKGAEFLAWCDEQLRADGVQVVHHHVKLAHPQLGKALAKLGYQPVETLYSRRLDRTQTFPRAGMPVMNAVVRGPSVDLLDFSALMQGAGASTCCDEDGG